MPTEKQVRKLQQRHIREDEEDRKEGLAHLLKHPKGRRYLWLLLADCGVFSNPFRQNALNMAFATGEQNIGQKILAEITATHPDAFLVLMKENQAVADRRDAEHRNLANERDDGDYRADDGD